MYISSVKLHSIHSQCGTNPQKLFLLLVEAFFSEETLATSLAHGSRTKTGTASLGKALNQDVVNTIKGKCHQASRSIMGFLISFVENDEMRPSISCQIILE